MNLYHLQPPQSHDVTATFVEIVGTVVDASTIKLLTCIDMGSKLGGSLLFHLTVQLTNSPSRLGCGEPSHRADIRSRVQGQNLLIAIAVCSPQTLPKDSFVQSNATGPVIVVVYDNQSKHP